MQELNPYTQRIYTARDLLIDRNQLELQQNLVLLYAQEIERIEKLLRSGAITPDNVELLMEQLRQALRSWQVQAEKSVKRSMINTIDGVGLIHGNTVDRVATDFGVEIAFNSSGFRADAFESIFTRRGLDMVKTYKTLNTWNAGGAKIVEGIEKTLLDGIQSGRNWREVQADVARALSYGNRDIRGLLQVVKDKKTISLSSLKIGGSESYTTINRLLSDARRIAVTEIDVAYHEGERIASIRNPLVQALKWQTSSRHAGLFSSPDICDVYEQANLYGLGEGVYFPETIPVKPHPNCACTRLLVTRDIRDWQKPKPKPTQARQASTSEIARILNANKTERSRKITPKFIQTTLEQTNRDNARSSQKAA